MTSETKNNKHFIDDKECIEKWKELIGRFNKPIENHPPIESVKKELLKIKEEAKNATLLTYRQMDAIRARVDNYLSGKYGNTKTAVQMSQSKTGFK